MAQKSSANLQKNVIGGAMQEHIFLDYMLYNIRLWYAIVAIEIEAVVRRNYDMVELPNIHQLTNRLDFLRKVVIMYAWIRSA